MYEGDDFDYEDEETPPEESSNRTFLIAAGILGGIVLLSIICLAGYGLVIVPRQQSAQQTQSAAMTQTAEIFIGDALTATALSYNLSQTPQVTDTPLPTDTPVVAVPTDTNTPENTNTPDPMTATVIAGQTLIAESTQTVVFTSTALGTALPGTGFADDVGLPGLFIMALVLIAVIFLARRLRASPNH